MSQKNVTVYGTGAPWADPVTEYLLPCHEMPEEVRATLHPWLRQMLGLRREEAQKIVEARWSAIEDELLVRVRQTVTDFLPKSVIVYRGKAWLGLERPFF